MTSKNQTSLSCPHCNGQLKYGVEEIVLHEKNIEPTTGKLMKRTTKRRVPNTTSRSFILCDNDDCDFIMDSSEPEDCGEHYSLFDKINKDDENSFAVSVMS